MRSAAGKRGLTCAAALSVALLAAGCSHMPWHKTPPPPPLRVHELALSGTFEFPQYWKRNTLLLDMSGATGSGSVTIKPVEGTSWPVRIAARVRPGSFPVLEVRGDQRLYLPVTTGAGMPVDLEFSPSLYTARTPQLVLSWGSAAQAPPAAEVLPVTPH
jgi:hypothetical protein